MLFRRRPGVTRTKERGPFDIIGDVHGCQDELETLLRTLGYKPRADSTWHHPDRRLAVFVGDLVDRGPRSVAVLKTAIAMSRAGNALCVLGNHDVMLKYALSGREVVPAYGLDGTLAELATESPAFVADVQGFLKRLPSHLVLDQGTLVIAHAGLRQSLHGRSSGRATMLAVFGETTGDMDEDGLPVRRSWADEYRGDAWVVYGHTPVAEPEWINRTIDIDTGCVYGARLTALRWPEKELVSVPAQYAYAWTARSFLSGRRPRDGRT